MVFKNCCVVVLWMKVASSLEELNRLTIWVISLWSEPFLLENIFKEDC